MEENETVHEIESKAWLTRWGRRGQSGGKVRKRQKGPRGALSTRGGSLEARRKISRLVDKMVQKTETTTMDQKRCQQTIKEKKRGSITSRGPREHLDGPLNLHVKRVLSHEDTKLSLRSGPLLRDDVPDRQRVERERERDLLGLAGGEGDAFEASEDGGLEEEKRREGEVSGWGRKERRGEGGRRTGSPAPSGNRRYSCGTSHP